MDRVARLTYFDKRNEHFETKNVLFSLQGVLTNGNTQQNPLREHTRNVFKIFIFFFNLQIFLIGYGIFHNTGSGCPIGKDAAL